MAREICGACDAEINHMGHCTYGCQGSNVKTALDTQVGGSHYKDMKIQPIKFIMANNLNYCQANVVKYVTRYKKKNGKQDLEKAIHYLQLLIEEEYGS